MDLSILYRSFGKHASQKYHTANTVANKKFSRHGNTDVGPDSITQDKDCSEIVLHRKNGLESFSETDMYKLYMCMALHMISWVAVVSLKIFSSHHFVQHLFLYINKSEELSAGAQFKLWYFVCVCSPCLFFTVIDYVQNED